MELSSITKKYIKLFTSKNNRKICNSVYTPSDIFILTKIFNKLYLDIKASYNFIHSNILYTNLEKNIYKFTKKNPFIFIDTYYDDKYFPNIIKQYIKLYTLYKITYNFIINKSSININFFIYENTNNYDIYDIYIEQVLVIIKMLFKYKKINCSKDLTISIYLTPFKKILPNANNAILNSYNVNSGFTTNCSIKSEIVIIRNEEWFKVLIHELFHNINLDFSDMNLQNINIKIKQIFPINSEFNIYEAYTEFWAKILNILIIGFLMLENKNDFKTFYNTTDFFIKIERSFSLYQLNKILTFIGIDYTSLYKMDKISIAQRYLYKENTNVFAYYIISALFLSNYTGFLSWCNIHNNIIFKFNPTENNLDAFYKEILNLYKNPCFLSNIEYIRNITNSNKIFNNKSLRMTCIELVK
jgi:hypothetical protein